MAFGSKDPLGLELQVDVSDDDLSSLDEDLRPPFQPNMTCPVKQCGERKYISINTLWKHWKKVHREKVPLYRCMFQKTDGLCSFFSTQVGDVRKHNVKAHKLDSTKWKINTELVHIIKYISPGDAKCPKRPTSLNTQGRDAAAAERRARPVLNEIKPGPNVKRDEKVTVTKRTRHGETVYKAHVYQKEHWKPKFNRK